MLPLTQQLKSWRHLCSVHHYHCHYRLLTSSTGKSKSENSTDQGSSFGRLAVSRQKNNIEKESNSSTEKLSEYYKGFCKPAQRYSNSWRVSSGLSQDNIPEKWHHFKDAECQESLARWDSGQQGDGKEDYQYFVSKIAFRSLDQGGTQWDTSDGKESSMMVAESIKEDVTDTSRSRRALQNSAKTGVIFGSLNPQSEEPEGDEGDLREERYQNTKLERKHRPHFYGFKMKNLCKEKKLAEAMKILEEEMPAAGTRPDNFCFQVLINACGRAGYTKKAFQLYNQMKKHGLKVEPVTYTGLFLACAYSPWPTTDGLKRATHLRSYLQEKNFQFNQIISHAMIKAFGWCGDMGTAFRVVDEMIQDGVLVTTETMNFLLQACITNKEVGFRHAVKVWRKMRELNLQLDIHSYNLLMHVIKDCDAGDPNLTIDLLKEERNPLSLNNTDPCRNQHSHTPQILNSKFKSLDSGKNFRKAPRDSAVHHLENYAVVENVNKSLDKGVLPNIIGNRMTAGNIVALGALDNPPDRLALLGGPSGILTQMKRDKVTPDLKTFTQMLESLPPDTQAEQALVESMKNLKLEPDTQFFNMIIKKRNFRHDIEAAQEVVTQMQHYHLIPDLITYGCLALGCRNFHSASQLLKDMDANYFRPNLEIMNTLVKNSLVRQDYVFTVAMLKETQQRCIPPNSFLLSMLEQARTRTRNILLDKHENSTVKQEKNKRSAKVFLSAYKAWLKDSKVQLPEHPWTQYW